MSTPCCQISTPHRLVVSEYEVPKVLVSQKWGVYSETLCINWDIWGLWSVFVQSSTKLAHLVVRCGVAP